VHSRISDGHDPQARSTSRPSGEWNDERAARFLRPTRPSWAFLRNQVTAIASVVNDHVGGAFLTSGAFGNIGSIEEKRWQQVRLEP
jgi:hypothetical protein